MDTITRDYWNQRYSSGGNSGYGSYGQQLIKKLQWLSDLDINSISEIGCGDFNFGQGLVDIYRVPYVGYDISDFIIGKNQEEHEESGIAFTNELSEVPPADLLVCVDVLFHVLDDGEYENILKEIDKRWTKYLAITAYEYERITASHLNVRKFDYRRFGEPVIREIVEEDGQMYFYLFKRHCIDLQQVSCCLNTKEHIYPPQILDHIAQFPFGEVLIRTDSDSPYRKYELLERAKFDMIYYQDDDAICAVDDLVKNYKEGMINILMDAPKIEQYKNYRMTMGLGWGSLFNREILMNLKRYTDIYGEDELFRRDTEKILTHLVYPQNRIVSSHQDLPTAMASDRLWRQPNHWTNMQLIIDRCRSLIQT
jgi:hypothetical protein